MLVRFKKLAEIKYTSGLFIITNTAALVITEAGSITGLNSPNWHDYVLAAHNIILAIVLLSLAVKPKYICKITAALGVIEGIFVFSFLLSSYQNSPQLQETDGEVDKYTIMFWVVFAIAMTLIISGTIVGSLYTSESFGVSILLFVSMLFPLLLQGFPLIYDLIYSEIHGSPPVDQGSLTPTFAPTTLKQFNEQFACFEALSEKEDAYLYAVYGILIVAALLKLYVALCLLATCCCCDDNLKGALISDCLANLCIGIQVALILALPSCPDGLLVWSAMTYFYAVNLTILICVCTVDRINDQYFANRVIKRSEKELKGNRTNNYTAGDIPIVDESGQNIALS